MLNLVLAAAVFVLIHLLVSGTRVRDGLIARIGEGPYMGLFSLATVGALVWMASAYGGAREDNPVWAAPGPGLRHLAIILQLLAFLLIVPGLLTPNPTSVKQEGVLDRPDAARGVLRITRHPFLWGVALWAFGHLLVNLDLASLILFGALLALAVLGTASIDAKRLRALGPKYRAFMDQTSNAPFAAVFAGRQKLRLGEIGWRLLAALAVYAAVFWAHPHFTGVSPLG
jgi:uncharacterized membrane protein